MDLSIFFLRSHTFKTWETEAVKWFRNCIRSIMKKQKEMYKIWWCKSHTTLWNKGEIGKTKSPPGSEKEMSHSLHHPLRREDARQKLEKLEKLPSPSWHQQVDRKKLKRWWLHLTVTVNPFSFCESARRYIMHSVISGCLVVSLSIAFYILWLFVTCRLRQKIANIKSHHFHSGIVFLLFRCLISLPHQEWEDEKWDALKRLTDRVLVREKEMVKVSL